VNVQFDWWLILVGFVLGAGLAWLVLAELHRREDDLAAREREVEAEWIAADMNAHGFPADAEAVIEVLRLHRTYLASIPPSDADLELEEGEPAVAGETEAAGASTAPGASVAPDVPDIAATSAASSASDPRPAAPPASPPRQADWQPEPRSTNAADAEEPRPVP
jgi:hypothetical protein